jgi:hypothetical protein
MKKWNLSVSDLGSRDVDALKVRCNTDMNNVKYCKYQ